MKKRKLKIAIMCRVVMLLSFLAVPAVSLAITESSVVNNPDERTVAYGIVVDKATGEPIITANVAVWAGGKLLTGTSTGLEGEFRIISPVSNFELQISFIGYQTVTLQSNGKPMENLHVGRGSRPSWRTSG